MWPLSACAWALPPAPPSNPARYLDRLHEAGFGWVDLRPDCWSGITQAEQLAGRGVRLGCAGLLPMPMPPGVSIDLLATPDFARLLPYLNGAIERAARLGAARAYITSPSQRLSDTTHYARAMATLAGAAANQGVRLCLEPHPGRALGSADEALAFVHNVGHENLYVLLDLGHCLITREDPAEAARRAGGRLGYVHIDDNDGKSDLHWPLFDGVLTRIGIEGLFGGLAGQNAVT